MTKQELLQESEKASSLIGRALSILENLSNEHPELRRFSIGNIDELVGNLSMASDVCGHLIITAEIAVFFRA
jgi:hypothetical protein